MQKRSTKAMLTMVIMSVFILCMGMTVCAAGGKTAPTQEILTASWSSGMLQVEDKVIQLPVRLSQLMQMGFTYENWSGYSKDYLISQNSCAYIVLCYNGVQVSMVTVYNHTDMPLVTVEQIDPLITEFNIYSSAGKLDIYFPGGIKLGDHFTTIQQKLGAAREISPYDLTHRYGTKIDGSGVDLGVEFGVDKRTQVINSMSVKKEVNVTTLDQMTPIALLNIANEQSDTRHNMAFLFMPEYLEEKDGWRTVKSIVQVGTELYGIQFFCDFEMTRYYGGRLGTPIYQQTDANGITHQVFYTGDQYYVVCIKGDYVFDGTITIKHFATDSTANVDALFRNTVIQIANSIVF